MRAIWLVGLAACGHARRAPVEQEPQREGAVALRAQDAAPVDASQDEELAALLPSNSPAAAPFTMATALPRIVIAAGPVPGAPDLVVERTPDPTHCGGEDVVVRVDSHAAANLDRELISAMTIATPRPRGPTDLQAWKDDAARRAKDALDFYHARIAASSGQPRVETEARAVLVERHYVDAILHMRPWSALAIARTPGGPRSIAGFCDALVKNLSPAILDADEAAARCRQDADNIGVGPGWWDDVCGAPGP